jgi:hypothetical protein
VLVDHVPVGQLVAKSVKLRTLEGRSAAAAGNASLGGEGGHGDTS